MARPRRRPWRRRRLGPPGGRRGGGRAGRHRGRRPAPAPFESLLAAADLAVVVLATDADPALASLALSGLPAPSATVQPPLAPGPARWAAMAGLARLRGLPAVASR